MKRMCSNIKCMYSSISEVSQENDKDLGHFVQAMYRILNGCGTSAQAMHMQSVPYPVIFWERV